MDVLFVYGKKVTDFRVLDYDQVFSTGLGAIQALTKKAATQQKIIDEQYKAIEALRAEIKSLVSSASIPQ